jgi:hypothetical protein
MSHLGKRRAVETDLDDFSTSLAKKHHAAGTFQTPAGPPAAEQLHQQWQAAPAAGQQHPQAQQTASAFGKQPWQPFPASVQPGAAAAAAASPSAVQQHQMQLDSNGRLPTGPLPPSLAVAGAAVSAAAAAAAPSQCTDLVLYQPQQHPLLGAVLGSPAATLLQQEHQQPLQPQSFISSQQQRQLKQQLDLGTASNDNAALKSVWRSLTPTQRRSLAGMWDMIKTEELLPRLMPNSGLLPLPACNGSSDPHHQQQQHTIIEEIDDDTPQQQQQQQQQHGAVLNGFAPGCSMATAAAAADDAALAGSDAMMQVDQLPDGATRQPSVEDMEM